MKLTKIAIAMVVVIGAVVTGGSWYTGKQIEQRYTELVNAANQQLASLAVYGMQVELKEVQIKRGLFSSDARYNVEVELENETYQFKGNDKLYHGPFPLNRLIKGNLKPVVASSEGHIIAPEALQHLVEEKVFLAGTGELNYAGTWHSVFRFSPIKADEWGLRISETVYESEVDKNGRGKGKFTLPYFNAISLQSEPSVDIALNHLEYDFAFDKTQEEYAYLGLGESKLNIGTMLFTLLTPKSEWKHIELTDIKSHSKNSLQGQLLEGKGDFSSNVVLTNHKDAKAEIGKITLGMKAMFDAKSLNQFLRSFILPDNEIQKIEQVQSTSLALLNQGFIFDLNELSIENSQGKSQVDLMISIDQQQALKPLARMEDLLGILEQAKLHLKLNQAMAEEAITQFVSLNPDSRQRARQIAQSYMANLIEMADQTDLIVVNSEYLRLDLEIEKGKIKLNGNEIPITQLEDALFLLMLILNAMQQ